MKGIWWHWCSLFPTGIQERWEATVNSVGSNLGVLVLTQELLQQNQLSKNTNTLKSSRSKVLELQSTFVSSFQNHLQMLRFSPDTGAAQSLVARPPSGHEGCRNVTTGTEVTSRTRKGGFRDDLGSDSRPVDSLVPKLPHRLDFGSDKLQNRKISELFDGLKKRRVLSDPGPVLRAAWAVSADGWMDVEAVTSQRLLWEDKKHLGKTFRHML
ncbi:hypothetical protein BTVI_27282 [Pitangus sulphuratus]|nr:hypothetical protein BTVI_27282 [Pitangus sulphuratus]